VNEDPQWLLDGDAISSALRRDLANARAADPGYDVAAGVARFEASLASAPASDGAPAGADAIAAAKTSTTWWILGGGAIAVAVVAWSVARDPSPTPVTTARDAPVVAQPRPSVIAPIESPAPAVEPRAAAPSPIAPAERADERPVTRKRSPAKADDALAREMAATAAAKRALATDPARALELVADANREFGGSVYAEDREGIAVLALAKLGRKDQARTRGEAYLGAHPKGSYADRIRSVLGDDDTTETNP
jgi:hypothetical protein